jgi:hypothetical protein
MFGAYMKETLIVAAWLWTIAWAISTAAVHGVNYSRFELTITKYGVLPTSHVRIYAVSVILTLAIAGSASAIRRTDFALLSGLAIAIVFASFAVGEAIAYRRMRREPLIAACGCMGGLLSADLTAISWLLPLGISVGATPLSLQPTFRFAVPDLATAVAIDLVAVYLLVSTVTVAAVWKRRGAWLKFMEARDD